MLTTVFDYQRKLYHYWHCIIDMLHCEYLECGKRAMSNDGVISFARWSTLATNIAGRSVCIRRSAAAALLGHKSSASATPTTARGVVTSHDE